MRSITNDFKGLRVRNAVIVAVGLLLMGASATACGRTNDQLSQGTASARTGAIAFSSGGVGLETAAREAPVAFRGIVEDFSIDPIEGDPAAVGRRLVTVSVVEVSRGDVTPGEVVKIWYGTELADGIIVAEGAANIVARPGVGTEILVMAYDWSLSSIGRVLVPVAGSGVALLDGDVVRIEATRNVAEAEELPLAQIEALLAEPAPTPVVEDLAEEPAEHLPRVPPTPPTRLSPSEEELQFAEFLEDIGMTEVEYMQLPGDEQQRLWDEHVGST